MTPRIDWQHCKITASMHLWLVPLQPYPIVCWVSRLNKNVEVKSQMLQTQGVQLPDATISASGRCASSRSPWIQKRRCQTQAKNNQEKRKLAKKIRNKYLHWRSTRVVQPSFRKRIFFSSMPMLITRRSPFFSTSLRTRFFLFLSSLLSAIVPVDPNFSVII